MLKIAIAEDYCTAEITQNDRGEWRYVEVPNLSDNVHYTFIGFGGENTITIHLMTMQSGKTDVVIVYGCVDGYFETRHKCINCGFSYEILNDEINKMLASLLTYPEVLP